jgi:hypothetical protein
VTTLNTQFEHELKKRLDEERLRIAEILCAGQAVKDYAEYCQYVGQYRAVSLVADSICDEVNTTINTR